MCGIVGYVGNRSAITFLIDGLKRLEYRGYDSAGTAFLNQKSEIELTKAVGRIEKLSAAIGNRHSESTTGIGHTRWATHGEPNHDNAHPHVGGNEELALCHNGVIENYHELRTALQASGFEFQSETDSEVIAHLLVHEVEQLGLEENAKPMDLLNALKNTIAQLRGTYGLTIIFKDYPDMIFAARLGSPLVVGVGKDEHFIASDAAPLAGYTDKIIYLADHQVAMITKDRVEVSHRELGRVDHDIKVLDYQVEDVGLNGYPHYMLKEIFEQPKSIKNTMRGRLNIDEASAVFGGLNLDPQELQKVQRIVMTACGTSWHSALVGEYMIEEMARIPVEVEYASELRYRNPPMDNKTVLFSITQSGETADTLAAQREMKRRGYPTLAICNVVGSTIAQEADGGIYLHAGPEIGVASTKAYSSQCVALAMLALYFGRLRHMSYEQGHTMITALQELPDQVETALQSNDVSLKIAEKYAGCDNFLYLGRQYNFPTALEGALKLKEISYVHAEGYPAAEMKHGPIALVDERTPSVFVMPRGFIYEKVMSNLEEIKARGGPVIAIAEEGDKRIAEVADDVIYIPSVEPFLQPIVSAIPLQLLAYHIAVLRGCDVDKPRNLAKSVTVE